MESKENKSFRLQKLCMNLRKIEIMMINCNSCKMETYEFKIEEQSKKIQCMGFALYKFQY